MQRERDGLTDSTNCCAVIGQSYTHSPRRQKDRQLDGRTDRWTDGQTVHTHHADFGLLAGAGGADELLQLRPELLVLPQHLVKLLHEVLCLALVRKVLCEEQRISSGPSETLSTSPSSLALSLRLSPNPPHTYWRWSSASPTWKCCWLPTTREENAARY